MKLIVKISDKLQLIQAWLCIFYPMVKTGIYNPGKYSVFNIWDKIVDWVHKLNPVFEWCFWKLLQHLIACFNKKNVVSFLIFKLNEIQ